jgi:hypothetical protein
MMHAGFYVIILHCIFTGKKQVGLCNDLNLFCGKHILKDVKLYLAKYWTKLQIYEKNVNNWIVLYHIKTQSKMVELSI